MPKSKYTMGKKYVKRNKGKKKAPRKKKKGIAKGRMKLRGLRKTVGKLDHPPAGKPLMKRAKNGY